MEPDQLLYKERVYRTSENRLYLTGGTNSVTALYTSEGFEAVNCEKWSKLIDRRRSLIEASDAQFIQLFVPEKLTAYPLAANDRAKVFRGYPESELIAPGRRLIDTINDQKIIYPDQYLREQSQHHTVFSMTDSHWTWKGAFSAFQLVIFRLGYKVNYQSFINLPKIKLRYRGDLWEPHYEGIPADDVERIQLPESILRVYANSLMGLKEASGLENDGGLHQGSHCIFVNNAAERDETAILFGSSFSECRLAPSLLTAIFSYYFRFVHFVWSPSLDFDYIRRNPAAVVLAESPERFLGDCPDDELSVEEHAVLKIRKWSKQLKSSDTTSVASPGAESSTKRKSFKDLPQWDLQKAECCRLIESQPATFKILLKTKNEPLFLEKWILYHLKIVGAKNLIVFDNMSDDEQVLAIYNKYAEKIVVVRFNTFHNFVHVTKLYPELYASLARSAKFFLFLDTDEFLTLYVDDKSVNDEHILEFLETHKTATVFPGLWLNNTDWNPARFLCGTTEEDLAGKAAWGKPIVRANAGVTGILLHNALIHKALYSPPVIANFFVLHMVNISVVQRITANVNKLIARGFASAGESPEAIAARPIDGIADGNVRLYTEEIKSLLALGDQPKCIDAPLRAGCFEILADGRLEFFSSVERNLIGSFMTNPTTIINRALALAKESEKG